MSALPSPLKSPTLTSTQVTFGFQVVHKLVENDGPFDTPTHHWPPCKYRPAMSILPSPLKSPTLTSSQVTAVLQVSQRTLWNPPEPLDWATHHWPVSKYRPAMSAKPSPLKSPDCTSTQVGMELQLVAREFAKLEPFEVPSHQSPVSSTRPMMSLLTVDGKQRSSSTSNLGWNREVMLRERLGILNEPACEDRLIENMTTSPQYAFHAHEHGLIGEVAQRLRRPENLHRATN